MAIVEMDNGINLNLHDNRLEKSDKVITEREEMTGCPWDAHNALSDAHNRLWVEGLVMSKIVDLNIVILQRGKAGLTRIPPSLLSQIRSTNCKSSHLHPQGWIVYDSCHNIQHQMLNTDRTTFHTLSRLLLDRLRPRQVSLRHQNK